MTEQNVVEEPKTEVRRNGWGRLGIFISTLAFIIFICGFGYGYFQLYKVNILLAEEVDGLQKRFADSQQSLVAVKQSVSGIQQSIQKSQDLSTQQEQVMAEWRAAQEGDLNKWHVAEADYVVKLANDQMQFTHNIPLAITLLQRGDQILENLPDANIIEIRKSLATVIANAQAVPPIDVASIYVRISGLIAQIDQLPFPVNPLSPENANPATDTDPTHLTWWKKGLKRTEETLRKIVIVRYNSGNSLPLALPDEKIFLYQNLHAQFESAMWGVLNRNADVYQAGLIRAQAWIKQYFAPDAAATTSMLQALSELQKINIQPPVINLADTLQLFDRYLSVQKTDQSKPSATQ